MFSTTSQLNKFFKRTSFVAKEAAKGAADMVTYAIPKTMSAAVFLTLLILDDDAHHKNSNPIKLVDPSEKNCVPMDITTYFRLLLLFSASFLSIIAVESILNAGYEGFHAFWKPLPEENSLNENPANLPSPKPSCK